MLISGLQSDKVFILDEMGRKTSPGGDAASDLSADSREGRSYTQILEKKNSRFWEQKVFSLTAHLAQITQVMRVGARV